MTFRWSAHSLDLHGGCGVAFERRYLDKDFRNNSNVANTVGSAVHMASRVDAECWRDERQFIADEYIPDVAADAFERTWGLKDPWLDKSERTDPVGTKGKAKDQVIQLEELHHRKVTKNTRPDWVEERLEIDIPGLTHSIIGYIDLGELDLHLHDTKTAAKTPSTGNAAQLTQAALYPMMAEVVTGKRPPAFTVDTIVKTKVPKVVSETIVPTGDYGHLLRRFEIAEKSIAAGIFAPASAGDWRCSARWCPFFEDCPFGRARRVAVGYTGE